MISYEELIELRDSRSQKIRKALIDYIEYRLKDAVQRESNIVSIEDFSYDETPILYISHSLAVETKTFLEQHGYKNVKVMRLTDDTSRIEIKL